VLRESVMSRQLCHHIYPILPVLSQLATAAAEIDGGNFAIAQVSKP
jgi:hypothetical protein